MKLYNALFIFCGTSIGPYFFSKFGEGLNTYGVKLSILSLIVAGFVMYKVMQLVSDLSSIKNVHSLYDITYALLPRYAVFLAALYVVFGMFLVGYYSFVVVGVGAQYGLSIFTSFCLLFSLFIVSTLNRDFLIRVNTVFNSLKLFLMVTFWVGCVVLLCKTGFAHQDASAITTPFSLSKLSAGLFLAGIFVVGMEAVVHTKSDMQAKDHRRATVLIPVIVISLYVTTLLCTAMVFSTSECQSNQIIVLFSQKLNFKLIEYLVLVVSLLAYFGAMLSWQYISGNVLKSLFPARFNDMNRPVCALQVSLLLCAVTAAMFCFSTKAVVGGTVELLAYGTVTHYPFLHLVMCKKNKQPVSVMSCVLAVVFLVQFLYQFYSFVSSLI